MGGAVGEGNRARHHGIRDAVRDDCGTRRKQSDTLIYADGADGPDVAAPKATTSGKRKGEKP